MNNIPPLLKRHCPKWYNLLKEIGFSELKTGEHWVVDEGHNNTQRLDLGDVRHCIIGEKHNFTLDYSPLYGSNNSCPSCYLMSDQLYYAKKERGFIFLLKKFVKHCEEKHKKNDSL